MADTDGTRAESAIPADAPRVFIHVDMDAFFAAIEQRDHPEWRGKPVVVGAPPDQRGVVSTASYEAREYGIHSAMPSSEAGRRCPHAIFVPPDMVRYEQVSAQVFAIFNRHTPYVEGLSIDEAFLEVAGSRRFFGDGREIAERIRADVRRETGLTCSAGVAPNKFLAKLGSEYRKPDGLTVLPFDRAAIAAFLRPLPVTRVWGVGKVMRAAFDRAALHTIGDLQDAPEALLRAPTAPPTFGRSPLARIRARSNSTSAKRRFPANTPSCRTKPPGRSSKTPCATWSTTWPRACAPTGAWPASAASSSAGRASTR